MNMGKVVFKIGNILSEGKYPCLKCGKRHKLVVTSVFPALIASWSVKEKHDYIPKNKDGG